MPSSTSIRMRGEVGPIGRVSSSDNSSYYATVVFDLPEPLPAGTFITFVMNGYRCGARIENNQSKSKSVAFRVLLRQDKKMPIRGTPTSEMDGYKFHDLPPRNGSASMTSSAAAASAAASSTVATSVPDVCPPPPPPPAAAPAAAVAAAAPAAAAPSVVVKPEDLTDAEIAEVKRRIHKNQTEEDRLQNKKVDPAYPARISKPSAVCEDDVQAMKMRIDTLEAQLAEYKRAGKRPAASADPPRSPDREYATEEVEVEKEEDSVPRKDYDDLNTKLVKVRKLCHDIGFGNVIKDALENPDKESELIKPAKDCVALINRNGGPEECAREIKTFKEFHRQRYSISLITLGLQTKDIVKIKVPGTDFYTLATVLGNPATEFPTCPHVATVFINDGDAHTNSTLSMSVGGDAASIQRFINNKDMIEMINSVFELDNLTKLYNSALALNYTKLPSKFAYAKQLYMYTVKALIGRFPEKKGFLMAHSARINQVLLEQGPVADRTQRYARAFSSSIASAAASGASSSGAPSSSSVVQID